jgi:microsomal dipeptidase-like Zn-dependent dipeptidase
MFSALRPGVSREHDTPARSGGEHTEQFKMKMLIDPNSLLPGSAADDFASALRSRRDSLLPLTFLITLLIAMALPAGAQVRPCMEITCPHGYSVECGGPSGSVVTFQPTLVNGCGTVANIVCTPPSGSVFPLGTNTVTCVASDLQRNSARCSFPVIVRDTLAPVILAPSLVSSNCTGPGGTVVNYDVVVRDLCDPQPQWSCLPPPGTAFPIGTNLVTCMAKDARGNQSSVQFPVVIGGACGGCLQIMCPAGPFDKTAGRDGQAVVTFEVTATNLCGGDAWILCEPPSGASFPTGTTLVQCTAGIGESLLKRCEFSVRVRDVTAPSILVQSPMIAVCQEILRGEGGAVVQFSRVIARDNADPSPTLQFSPPSGSFFPLGSNSIVATATDASGNQATVNFTLIVTEGPACEVEFGGQGIDPTDNWDFELGLRTWKRTGAAFATQPTLGDNVHVRRIPELVTQIEDSIGGDYWKDLAYPIGHHAEHWIGTAENHPDDTTAPGTMQGDQMVGTLLSKAFIVPQRYITFLVGGGNDPAHLRVELVLPAQAGEAGAFQTDIGWFRAVLFTTGHGTERLRRETFDANPYVGQTARLRILDDSSTGHLNVDDFRFQPQPPSVTQVRIGSIERPSVIIYRGLYYDWDSPVWGLADLHTHPISHLGLGQKVFHGQPDGVLSQALGNCNCNHGGHGLDNECGNYLRQLVLAGFDGENTADPHQLGWDYNQWSRFRKWPVFTSFSHQQMWFEWVRRAYDGGLRVMVALTVHNKLLAGATVDSVKPYDDVSVMEAQIKELKAFVSRHEDFMEIAYDPIDLRRIVRDNKLAIIIGSETDDIGNFDRNAAVHEGADAVSRMLVSKRIQDLYDLGLRYIFPVHLTDNKFGGTAIYNPLFTMATKYYMGVPIDIEPAGNGVVYRLPNLDATSYLPDAGQIFGSLAEAIFNPFAPLKLALESSSKITGQDTSFSDSSIGMAGIGAVATLPMIASSPVSMAAAPALFEFFGDVGSLDLPSDVLPLGDNYPHYASTNKAGMPGHRNAKGLTTLGEFAVCEMMRLGMIVDLDHMGEKGVDRCLELGEQVPGGYPLNSGHNSFRAQRYDASENSRTPEQLARIRNLGGLMGLGWGNGDRRDVGTALDNPRTNSTSQVVNNSPGSSKTFAHAALYALEFMQGKQVALGSDINGYVVGPGPRFGPQSAFGLREDEDALAERSKFIKDQTDGVAYSPREGRPAASGVFNGRAVDQDKDDQDARTWKGFAYNKQQRDFFVALRIFRWGWQRSPKLTHDEVEEITDRLHDAYDRDRVKEFARGLLLGPTNGDPGWDTDGDVNVKQKLAKAVYRKRVLGENPPSEITNDTTKNRRYHHFLTVWDDYEGIYGGNTPMKRCTTHLVEWDYNYDGLAHYGLLPDFFQDLRNVGLNDVDMSPMFKSAEDFARMWTRCLQGADAISHPRMTIATNPRIAGGALIIDWFGKPGDQLEETDAFGTGWRLSQADIRALGDGRMRATLPLNLQTAHRFYRVRK